MAEEAGIAETAVKKQKPRYTGDKTFYIATDGTVHGDPQQARAADTSSQDGTESAHNMKPFSHAAKSPWE